MSNRYYCIFLYALNFPKQINVSTKCRGVTALFVPLSPPPDNWKGIYTSLPVVSFGN